MNARGRRLNAQNYVNQVMLVATYARKQDADRVWAASEAIIHFDDPDLGMQSMGGGTYSPLTELGGMVLELIVDAMHTTEQPSLADCQQDARVIARLKP